MDWESSPSHLCLDLARGPVGKISRMDVPSLLDGVSKDSQQDSKLFERCHDLVDCLLLDRGYHPEIFPPRCKRSLSVNLFHSF